MLEECLFILKGVNLYHSLISLIDPNSIECELN